MNLFDTDNLVKLLKKSGISQFVYTTPIENNRVNDGCSIEMEDVRSAAFYAFGESLKNGKSVALFVEGEYLSSTLTAITEAWFQKANVIVIAFFKKIEDVQISWMDRCLLEKVTFEETDLTEWVESIQNMVGKLGPCLINYVGANANASATKTDYSNIVRELSDTVPAGTKIFCYALADKFQCDNIRAEIIPEKFKYGVISKYIGSSAVHDAGYLICTSDCVLVDINIFRTRYKTRNMKIIVVDSDGKMERQNILQWIKSNGWKVIDTSQYKKELSAFITLEEPTVMLVRGDYDVY